DLDQPFAHSRRVHLAESRGGGADWAGRGDHGDKPCSHSWPGDGAPGRGSHRSRSRRGHRADRVPVRTWSARKEATAVERITRAATNEGFNLTFVIGGALLFGGASAGLYWVAAGDILCIIAIVLSAWVLMIEILR